MPLGDSTCLGCMRRAPPHRRPSAASRHDRRHAVRRDRPARRPSTVRARGWRALALTQVRHRSRLSDSCEIRGSWSTWSAVQNDFTTKLPRTALGTGLASGAHSKTNSQRPCVCEPREPAASTLAVMLCCCWVVQCIIHTLACRSMYNTHPGISLRGAPVRPSHAPDPPPPEAKGPPPPPPSPLMHHSAMLCCACTRGSTAGSQYIETAEGGCARPTARTHPRHAVSSLLSPWGHEAPAAWVPHGGASGGGEGGGGSGAIEGG